MATTVEANEPRQGATNYQHKILPTSLITTFYVHPGILIKCLQKEGDGGMGREREREREREIYRLGEMPHIPAILIKSTPF